MPRGRRAIPADTRRLVLHECGYKCSNPACRNVITLDVHHLAHVAAGGADRPENLLALCPYCHAMHHAGQIPADSLRSWKLLLLALNEGFDRRSIDLLLALKRLDNHYVTLYTISLSARGKQFVGGWGCGDQLAAVGSAGLNRSGRPRACALTLR